MTLDIDYTTEQKGWVLVREDTGELFKGLDGNGWYGTTRYLANAYFFPSKAKAVAATKQNGLGATTWIVAPAKVTETIEATRGMRVKAAHP